MPIIKSSSDLQRNIGEVYEICHETRQPVYITRNGRADLVVMDAQAFDEREQLQNALYEREMRAYEGIMRGYEDHREGRTVPFESVRRPEACA